MEYSTHYIESKKLYGLSVVISKSQNKNFEIISNFWKEFNLKLKQSNLLQKSSGNWEKYGITYQTDGIYKYFCGVPVENDRENTFFEERKIIDGCHAVFQHQGAMFQLKHTFNTIYRDIIPNDKLAVNQSEYFHFELYNYKFKWNSVNSIIKIYLLLNNN